MSIIEKLYTSLANLHTMLTRYRGFEGTEETNVVFEKADKIKMLPIDSLHHRQVCFLAYRLNLLKIDAAPAPPANDITNDILANIKNAEWIAVHTRDLIYVQRADTLPVHKGITRSSWSPCRSAGVSNPTQRSATLRMSLSISLRRCARKTWR